MEKIKQCALWQKPELVENEDHFENVDTYMDTSHLLQSLLKCRECKLLYFFEFYEEINWLNEGDGKDYQYTAWIPVAEHDPISLKDKYPMELLSPAFEPRIQEHVTPHGNQVIRWVR